MFRTVQAALWCSDTLQYPKQCDPFCERQDYASAAVAIQGAEEKETKELNNFTAFPPFSGPHLPVCTPSIPPSQRASLQEPPEMCTHTHAHILLQKVKQAVAGPKKKDPSVVWLVEPFKGVVCR